jgi:DNA-binding response OmpR family regulator
MAERINDPPFAWHSLERLGVVLDPARRMARARGKELPLTPTEWRLLECLLRRPVHVHSRADLMAAAIAGGAIVLERTIDQHVCSLRRKLAVPGLIETVRGAGYRLHFPPSASA